ncbi:MAG: Ig-like domain-containing protein, partial [Gemmatimonas sp.]
MPPWHASTKVQHRGLRGAASFTYLRQDGPSMRVFAPIARPSLRRAGAAAVLSLAGLGLSSCLDLNPNVEACTVTVAPTIISVPVNGRQPIVGTAFDCKGNSIRDKKISFSTANPAIATVAQDGSVIGISVGQTSISATANKGSATAQVTVTPEVVSSVAINPPSVTLRVTNSRTFQAVLRNGG